MERKKFRRKAQSRGCGAIPKRLMGRSISQGAKITFAAIHSVSERGERNGEKKVYK